MPESREKDRRWMARALALARKGEGLTRPNPPVGAVVVKGARVVGEGYHRKAGGPHAEVYALRSAGATARGGTLYVTLEPCSTWGRTPPCVDAILAAGIARVVVASRDPNPAHAGKGLRLLKRKGVRVEEGVLREEGDDLIRPFAKWISRGRPFVTLKLGMSLDGAIADRLGSSRWITGPQARRRVHQLRRCVDAVMVGAQTVAMDDPQLLPRPAGGRQPFRVIVDGRGRVPPGAQVLTDASRSSTILATTQTCPAALLASVKSRGVSVESFTSPDARVPLDKLMKRLGRRGILHVLCEGGGELAEGLLKARQVDEIWFFIAPKIIGGRDAVRAVAGSGWPLSAAPELRIISEERVGADLLVRAAPQGR